MPATRDDLLRFLGELGIDTTTVDHPPLHTVEQSRALRGDIPGGHTKNLFLKDREGRLFLVVALEDATIDLKTLHKSLGCGRLSFGNAELLAEVLGVEPGSVTPFGLINDTGGRVSVTLDAAMMEHEVLNYHPLTNAATTTIRRADLIRFIEATDHEPAIRAVSAGGA